MIGKGVWYVLKHTKVLTSLCYEGNEKAQHANWYKGPIQQTEEEMAPEQNN